MRLVFRILLMTLLFISVPLFAQDSEDAKASTSKDSSDNKGTSKNKKPAKEVPNDISRDVDPKHDHEMSEDKVFWLPSDI